MLVANLSTEQTVECYRVDGRPLFIDHTEGDEYYIEYEVQQDKSVPPYRNRTQIVNVTMKLQWNITQSNTGIGREVGNNCVIHCILQQHVSMIKTHKNNHDIKVRSLCKRAFVKFVFLWLYN